MSHSFGFAIESLVAFLLILTIGYCMLLNKRLMRLRSDEQAMRSVVAELIAATDVAERAIGGLRLTVQECEQNLTSRLEAASAASAKLTSRLAASEMVLRRLSQIATAAHVEIPEPVQARADEAPKAAKSTKAKALLAAAQAFSERQRAGLAA